MSIEGFRVHNGALGQTLGQLKSGVSTTQTPIVLVGNNGPFTLTGDQLATSLGAGLVVRGTGQGPVSVVLPSTATILNVLSSLNVNTTTSSGSDQTYGAWVSLHVINESASQVVNIVAGDGATGVTQQGTSPSSAQTYVLYEVLTIGSAFQVRCVQDLNVTIFPQPQYVTAQFSTSQIPGGGTAFPIEFDVIYNQSPLNNLVNYSVLTNLLTIAGNTTALINGRVTIANVGNVPIQVDIELSPFGQVAAPLVGTIAGSANHIGVGDAREFSFSVVQRNLTTSPTAWSVYLTGYTPGTAEILVTAASIPQLTATQIV